MTDIVPAETPQAPVGLEDIDETNLAFPRLNIIGPDAVFQDSLSNERYDTLETVVLGLVHQRVLWPADVPEGGGSKPLCRSRDAKIGLPQKDFPWASTGFTLEPGDEQQELSCAACPLQQWGSHPTRAEIPWCNEQFTVVLYHEGGPAMMTIQRSGLAAVRNFATSFVRLHIPTFTKYTTIGLTGLRRGTVRYAVPVFTTGEETPVEDHDFYEDMYRKARAFLTSTRRRDDNAEEQVAKAAVRQREPATVDENEDPF